MARQCYRIDPENRELISKEDWHAKYGSDDAVRGSGPMIIPDIDPYRSTIDGSMITSRSHHKRHLREHGREEIGTESMAEAQTYFKKPEPNKKEVKAAVIDAYNKLESKK